MKQILFILSAAYCDPELQAEFGKIPACLVPIGPRTLLDLQLDLYKDMTTIFVALPQDYDYSPLLDKYKTNSPVFVCMTTASMDDTFIRLVAEARRLYPSGQVILHVLNGDTLIPAYHEQDSMLYAKEYSPFNWRRGSDSSAYLGKLRATVDLSELDLSYDGLCEDLPQEVVNTATWFDFGHAHTYFRSKRDYLSSRFFNTLEFSLGKIHKRGKTEKILAEYNWYKEIQRLESSSLRFHTPGVIQQTRNSYAMEYLALPTLAELFVHGNLPVDFWKHISGKLVGLLGEFRVCPQVGGQTADSLFLYKAKRRVVGTEYESIADHLIGYLIKRDTLDKATVIHGDLCFSNILYDSRADALKIIDPRGLDSFDQQTIYGSHLYDVAKLYHSAAGLYDHAVANSSKVNQQASKVLSEALVQYVNNNTKHDDKDLSALTALLFFSMLPLHADDLTRQQRLAKCGLRMYKEWDSKL